MGCFAEYTVAEAAYVGRIPEALTFSQAAPILCAGVTTYKALKETECKPGNWVAILGACGGLGHVGCQYAKAMGLKVCAVDFGADKGEYALKTLGCDGFVDVQGKSQDQIVAAVKEACDGVGAHGSVILAPRPEAYQQGVDMLRPMGFAVGIALPPGSFPVDIFTLILHRKTVRGSIVGTRKDLNDCLKIAGDGKVKCTIEERKLEDINDVLEAMAKGKIKGRCVLRVAPAQLLPSRRSARPKSAAGGFRPLRTFVEVSLSQVTPGHAPRCLHFSGMSRAVFEFLRFLAPGRKAFGLWPGEGARRRFCLGGTARSPSRQLNCVTHQVLKQHFGFKSCRAQRPVQ